MRRSLVSGCMSLNLDCVLQTTGGDYLDEAFGIVGVPGVGVDVGGDFEGVEVDLVTQQTTDATKTAAELVALLRLV